MFLTSLFATMVAMPAFADNNSYTNNQTYENSCTVDVLGESSGTAPATAQWSANTYSCAAGEYLPDGDNWTTDNQGCTQCPAGSYCWGDTFTYSESGDQGINSCPVGYPSSVAGASSQGECYTACTTSQVAHSVTSVSGNSYSDGTNTCEATSGNCATGYTYVARADTSSYQDTGIRYKSHDGNNDATDGEALSSDTLALGEWRCDFTQGELQGIASCNNIAGENYDEDTSAPNTMNTSSTGQYCWCRATHWMKPNGEKVALSGAWVFLDGNEDAGGCADACAFRCAYYAVYDSGFRGALLGSVGAIPAHCAANTITVNWGDGDNNPNNNPTTQCIYDGALTTPATAPTKRGYTFTGWTFSTQQ